MFARRSFTRVGTSFTLILALVSPIAAQAPPALKRTQELEAEKERHALAILAADSAHDVSQAIGSRLELASMSKPQEAQVLYSQALAIADSAHLEADAIAAQDALARILAGRGQMKQAYEAAMGVVERTSVWTAERLATAEEKLDSVVRAAALEHDSLAAGSEANRRFAETSISQANEHARFWMWITAGVTLLALLAIVVMRMVHARYMQQRRTELTTLQAELATFQERARNRLRPTDAWPAEPVEPSIPVAPSVVVPLREVDPMVLALFHRQAPERMAALRLARLNGDHEKVQRVVHTLKPQLTHFDPQIGQLCACIAEVDAWRDGSSWNAKLDELMAAVERILGGAVTPGSPTS